MSSFIFTAFPTMIKKSGGHTTVIAGIPNEGDLAWYFDADSPGAGNAPIDLGPNTLGTMSVISATPSHGANGPNGKNAWGFTSAGFYKLAGTSTTLASNDYTTCVMFQMQPYAAGFHGYIMGWDNVNDIFNGPRLEGGHTVNGGGGDSQTFTFAANSPTQVLSGGGASPDTTWYILGSHHSSGNVIDTFLGEVGQLDNIDTAGTVTTSQPLGDNIRLGGQHDSFATQGMRGFIWKGMAWTGQVDQLDIYAWAKDQAGL